MSLTRREFLKVSASTTLALSTISLPAVVRAMDDSEDDGGERIEYTASQLKEGVVLPDMIENNVGFRKSLEDVKVSVKKNVFPNIPLKRGLDPFSNTVATTNDSLVIWPGAPLEVVANFSDEAGRVGKVIPGLDQSSQELFPIAIVINTEASGFAYDVPATPSAPTPTPAPFEIAVSSNALRENLSVMEQKGEFIGVNWLTSGGVSTINPALSDIPLGKRLSEEYSPNPMGMALQIWNITGKYFEDFTRGGMTILVGNNSKY